MSAHNFYVCFFVFASLLSFFFYLSWRLLEHLFFCVFLTTDVNRARFRILSVPKSVPDCPISKPISFRFFEV